jgi:hypothetical protein
MVSINGSPAATSEPNASTRMTRVTGQLRSSLFIIASRLAALKSLHSDDDPVRATCTPGPPSARSGSLRPSAARTISLVFASAAPAWMSAVRPSSDTDTPGRGGTTWETRSSARSSATARSTTSWPRPLVTDPRSTCTTT